MKFLLPLMYPMPRCISVKYQKILGFSLIIRITTSKSYFSVQGDILMRQDCVFAYPLLHAAVFQASLCIQGTSEWQLYNAIFMPAVCFVRKY